MNSYLSKQYHQVLEHERLEKKLYAWLSANTSHPDFEKKLKELHENQVAIEIKNSRIENYGNGKFCPQIYPFPSP